MRAKKKINGVEIDVIVDTVERIEDEEIVCHPARLVDESRPEDSPTHQLFEWDDSRAGEQWRVHQARQVIARIQVVTPAGKPAPRFVHVQEIREDGTILNGYQRTYKAMRGDNKQAVLMDAVRQLKGLQTRYEGLSDLAPVWDAIERVKTELEGATA